MKKQRSQNYGVVVVSQKGYDIEGVTSSTAKLDFSQTKAMYQVILQWKQKQVVSFVRISIREQTSYQAGA